MKCLFFNFFLLNQKIIKAIAERRLETEQTRYHEKLALMVCYYLYIKPLFLYIKPLFFINLEKKFMSLMF